MNKKALIELVIISVEFMSFSCNDQYYDHKDELFIGSPTPPTFAELDIQRVEEIHVSSLQLRNVDDTFVTIKYDKIETFGELNKFNWKVQFTYESETNNTLPFLYFLIERVKLIGRLQAKVYRKKIHTGEYMYYTSNQTEHVKVGTIKTLERRAKIVCSTDMSLPDERDYIKKQYR